MKRIGWDKGDGPLKTPEIDRILSLDLLFKELLLEHRENQKEYFKKIEKKWSDDEYVFRNRYNEPYTPDILSKNFTKFVKRHKDLSHIVIYSLRHSFATHCKNNSELVHLQNKVSNLQELQQDDIINYVQLDNNTLSTLTTILTKIIQKQRVVA